MKYYNITEIYNQKLLKKFDGTAYSDKAGVSNALNRFFPDSEIKKAPTPHGIGKYFSEEQIKRFNASRKLEKVS